MKIIGIVPGVRLKPDWYEGEYFFKDTYTTRVTEADGIPVGLVAVHGRIAEDELAICDAFLIQGGQCIMPYQLQVIDYAVKHNKPLLGVCLGMQAIHTYFIVMQEKESRGFDGDFIELYERMKKERYYFVEPVADHNSAPQTCYADENVRFVNVKEGTNLSKLIPASCEAAMRHSYRITKPADCVTVSCIDQDGETIEGIEVGDQIIGVQFHPEVVTTYLELFRFLTK